MSLPKRALDFIDSPEGIAIRRQLEKMETDALYNTSSSYSAKTEIYADNLIPFVDKHMNYLTSHPSLNPDIYLSNLRLMTRLKVSASAR